MEPRVTETDLAMLLLGEDDLLTLGAMLGLRARGVEIGTAAADEGSGNFPAPGPGAAA